MYLSDFHAVLSGDPSKVLGVFTMDFRGVFVKYLLPRGVSDPVL